MAHEGLMMSKHEAIKLAADHIRLRTSDIGGQMVLAAFMQDSIDQEYGDGTERKEDGDSSDGSDHDTT